MKTSTKVNLKSKCPKALWNAAKKVYRGISKAGYKAGMKISPDDKNVFCSCCGLRFKKFKQGDHYERPDFYDLSLFSGQRQDIACPYCGSLPRHRILAAWCNENIDLIRSKDILYFAPEKSMTIWMDSNGIKFKTADLYDPEADLNIDIQKTGLESESFDVIICNHVLEHVSDVMTALNEMKRILRSGGLFICSFPVSPDVELVLEDPSAVTGQDRRRVYGQSDHVRLFGMKADTFMKDAGFDVTVISGDDYPFEILPVTGPCKYDINRLFLCKKPLRTAIEVK
ncbi:MAG: methyltransferase domain-containing protein [Ruminococcaceae bacterium]|nr:methyltransferase domain-containing protein [Oscillospiraceae bacterium]